MAMGFRVPNALSEKLVTQGYITCTSEKPLLSIAFSMLSTTSR